MRKARELGRGHCPSGSRLWGLHDSRVKAASCGRLGVAPKDLTTTGLGPLTRAASYDPRATCGQWGPEPGRSGAPSSNALGGVRPTSITILFCAGPMLAVVSP